MTKDICYIAQRSSDPNAVKAFLEALPPGTLESGVTKIPDEGVRKRFKLRSPNMTKALIKLGVDADVVAGYYAAFASKQESEEGRVYHMTTFPNADIMIQQSETKHFTSCMAHGELDGDSGGSYYDEYIDHDIEAYKAGDLGLFVVGQHAHNIQVGDVTHCGNGIGFVARAKIRVMYKHNKRSNKLEKAALLLDRIYGNVSLLVDQISTLLEWNSANFNLPVIVRSSTVISDRKALRDFMLFGEDYEEQTLFFPHDGYMDSMSQSSSYRGGFDCRSLTVGSSSDWGLIDTRAKIWNCGLQYKTYSLAKIRRTAPLNTIPISKHFIERASNKLICRHEPTSRESWRYDYFNTGRKDDLLLRLQVEAMRVFVSHYFRAFHKMYEEYFKLTPLRPLMTRENHMYFALGEEHDLAIIISSWFSHRGRLEFSFGFYHARYPMKEVELTESSLHKYEYESSATIVFNLNNEKGSATLVSPLTYDEVAQVVNWFPMRFDKEETTKKFFEFVDTFTTNLKELCENPSLDKSRRMRYNGKRVKKVLKPLR